MTSAQLGGFNLLEYQFGTLPEDREAAFSTIYGRTLADYSFKKFRAGVTVEQFYSAHKERNYTSISQYWLQYSSGPLKIKLGNFYETLGRGLLLRSFEIPNSLLEDKSYRTRYYNHRDISGINIKYRRKNFSTTLLYGKPLNNVLPPGMKVQYRRPDKIAAIHSDFSFKSQIVAASVLGLDNNSGRSWYGMTSLSGILWPFLSYYTEIAKNINRYAINDFNDKSAYAYYASLNLSFGSMNMSLEYKFYNNFILGTGFNEPPALVKEHTYLVLNRSSHVSQPFNEKGYQIELFYTYPDASRLTVNHTLAINNFAKEFIYQEYFIEYSTLLLKKHVFKIFLDYAKDPFKMEHNRISTGVYADFIMNSSFGLKTDCEFQSLVRNSSLVKNIFISITSDYRSKISGNLTIEISNDPFLIAGNNKTWFGGSFGYKINSKNNIQLFAGQRRGGPACNSGVCYEILDFKGIELRLKTRF